MSEPLLTITVVGYHYVSEWEVFINSLLLQTDDRWRCDIWNDGPDSIAEKICMKYVDQYPEHFTFRCTPTRFNDWGHSMRMLGLAETDTKYWATQNADNYLMPTYVEYTLTALENENLDLVIFPCVHNYPNVNGRQAPPYMVLDVAPRKNRCDAGTMVLKTRLAQKVGWNHTVEIADGLFIDEIMQTRPSPKVQTLPNILMVHN